MTPLARFALAVTLVATATACSEPTTYSPPQVVKAGEPVTEQPPPPPLPFPALTMPGTIYSEASEAYSTMSRLPTLSRYVLYADGTHVLQLTNARGVQNYIGRWTRADSTIVFEWEGWSAAGPWGATGVLRGDQLVVKYNLVMEMTDFIDATYVRAKDPS